MDSQLKLARLAREMKTFRETPPWGIQCKPVEEGILDKLEATILGPRGTPYENGTFKLDITIPDKYPMEPPIVVFRTPIYHPNIDTGGRICMDMLKMPPPGSWLPTITLETLLIALQTLIVHPNIEDPLRIELANEYKCDIESFMRNAKLHTETHAK